ALDRLVARLQVFRDADQVWLNPGLTAAIAAPAGLGPPVRSLLEPMTADDLRGLATRLGGAGKAKRKADLFELVLGRLVDPGVLAEVLARAPAAALSVLHRARSARVELPYDVRYWRPAAYHPRQLDGPHRWLLGHGLLFGSSWNHAVVPREVGLALRGSVIRTDAQPTCPPLAVVDADQPALDRAGANRAAGAIRLVGRLLEELTIRPAEPLKAGGLGAREIKRLAKATDADQSELRLGLELARVAGLMPMAWGAVAPTPAGEGWLHDEPATRWLALARAWLADPGAPLSLNGTKDPQGSSIPNGVDVHGLPATPLRQAIFRVFDQLGQGRAATGAIYSAVSWQAPSDVDRLDADLGSRVIDWLIDEAGFLGLVSSGGLTTVGRALWAGDFEAAAAAAGGLVRPVPATIIVQADHTIVVDAGAPPALLAELRILADVESSGAALVLRIGPGSVRRALDAGRSGPQLVDLLAEHAPAGVPQPITYLIEDTARRWGRVRTGQANCYVRSDDPGVLAEAVAHRKLARLGLRLLAPTVAVGDGSPEAVLEALRECGFLPAAEGPDGTVLTPRPVRHCATSTGSAAATLAADATPAAMTGEERLALVDAMLAAPDVPVRRPAGRHATDGPAARPHGRDLGGRQQPGFFDGQQMSDVIDLLTGLVGDEAGGIDAAQAQSDRDRFDDFDDLDDLDDADDDVDPELVDLMAEAELTGCPVELLRLEAGTFRAITGRVLMFDALDLVAIVAQEPGEVEVVVDLTEVMAFRSLRRS
ncbi:MAG: helicase-associated domain-containing protein, partial [Ilumatobacteraceae bacterium]